jgi:hypothetical protein
MVYDDTAMILDRSTPVARKTHYCDCCEGVIPAGEKYMRVVNKTFDGKLVMEKFHYSSMECAMVMEQMVMEQAE